MRSTQVKPGDPGIRILRPTGRIAWSVLQFVGRVLYRGAEVLGIIGKTIVPQQNSSLWTGDPPDPKQRDWRP